MVVAALSGLALLVVLASGRDPSTERWIGTEFLRTAVLVLFALTVLAALAITILVTSVRGPAPTALPSKNRAWIAWVVLAIVMLMVVVIDPRPIEDDAVDDDDEEQVVLVAPIGGGDDGGAEASIDRSVGRADMLAFAAALGLAGAVVVWSRRRSRASEPGELDEDAALVADLAPVLRRASDELVHGDEPRAAVLTAYAMLERALSDRGRPREQFETPAEHLTRVLAALPIDGAPLIELGRLYGVARYSEHAVTVADQRRAATALDRSRSELEAHEAIA